MSTLIGTIIEKAFNIDGPYDIHTYAAHERTQYYMGGTNARFFMTQSTNNGQDGVKDRWRVDYSPIPNNHIVLPKMDNPLQAIPVWANPVATISHTKFGQFATSAQLSSLMGWGHIHYEHTWPRHEWSDEQLQQIKQMKADINVFISSQSALAWKWELDDPSVVILHHAVDNSLFKPNYNTKKPVVMAANNDWIGRGSILGFDLFESIVMKNNLPYLVVGDTPGLSKAALNVYDLVSKYNQANIFVNFARESPLPTVLIESMACGCVPVSLDVCMCSELIQNGVNGYKSNDPKIILEHLRRLINSPDECRQLGENARQTIIDRFPLSKFISTWNDIFQKVARINK